MSSAPIVIFCYKRIDTLQQCLDSLQKCKESIFSDLIIISDAPAKDTDKEKVDTVRRYIVTISGFRSIEIIERPENLGVDFNIIQGLKELSQRFESFIIVEDDILVAPDFLNYINKALAFYESNPSVLTVSAFSYIKRIPKSYRFDVYFAARTNPWGWATWSAKIKDVNWHLDGGDKEEFLTSKKIQRKFNEWGSDRSMMLRNTLNNKIRAWDIRLDYFQFKTGSYTVYPIQTLTQNLGFGREDASNTFGHNRFVTESQESLKYSYTFPGFVILNSSITRKYKQKNSISQRILTRLLGILRFNKK